MSQELKTDPKKALKHEAKGDKLAGKEKFRDALKEYQISESLNPHRAEIYEKLITTHGRFEHEWVEEDFSNSMTWTMRYQELTHPQMKWVHQSFTVEYKEVQKLAQNLLIAPPEVESRLIEQILAFKEAAALPLIHFILRIKEIATAQGNADDPAMASPETPNPDQA